MAWAGKILQFASDAPWPTATLDEDAAEDEDDDEAEEVADEVEAEDEAAPDPAPMEPPPLLPLPPQAANAAMMVKLRPASSGFRMAPLR